MSGTRNEFDEPGANYPDSAKDPAEAAGVPPQDGPALAQNVATERERLDGVVQQVRADVGGESVDIVEKSLRSRLDDVGITVADDEVAALARDIAAG